MAERSRNPVVRAREKAQEVVSSNPRIRREARKFGRGYRGREGQWSWLLHRITGVGIILFLFAHIVDTALVGWGPEAYNKVVAVYHNPFIRVLELALVGMVIYHALNGVRIMLIDFFPGLTRQQHVLFWAEMVLFVGSMIPISWIIGKPVLQAWFGWP